MDLYPVMAESEASVYSRKGTILRAITVSNLIWTLLAFRAVRTKGLPNI